MLSRCRQGITTVGTRVVVVVVVSTPGTLTITALPCTLRMKYLLPLHMAEGGITITPECEEKQKRDWGKREGRERERERGERERGGRERWGGRKERRETWNESGQVGERWRETWRERES